MTTSKSLQDIGRCAYECIAEMVAALECDYDRLEELRTDLRAVCDEQHGEQGATFSEFKEWLAKIAADNNCGDYCGDVTELAELEQAAGECENRDDAERRIHEDPLSIELSGTWVLGEQPKANKALILLDTGGPATRIVCDLDDDMQPTRAYLQTQDWGTPWTDYVAGDTGDTLLTYCRQFYFGEG